MRAASLPYFWICPFQTDFNQRSGGDRRDGNLPPVRWDDTVSPDAGQNGKVLPPGG